MLPVHRVIGHKEYGNTPPGGWSGRKVDPVYSMNWRRQRVADFKPRNAAKPQQEDELDANEKKMLAEVHHELVTRRPTRANDPGSKYTDTNTGYSINADAHGWNLRNIDVPEILEQIAGVRAVLDGLVRRVEVALDNNTPGT